MTFKIATLVALLGPLATGAALAQADTPPELDPIAAKGKVIFEETAGGVGCASCHGPTAEGDVGPNIQGRDAVAILEQLETNEAMEFISLTNEERDQVAAYLRYLHDQVAH